MNPPFLVDGDECVAVFLDAGERGGCYSFANRETTECKDCKYEGNCPADGEDE